jgi:hypothetical protein
VLSGPQLEDVVVGHWILFNQANPGRLIERFDRHRRAMLAPA